MAGATPVPDRAAGQDLWELTWSDEETAAFEQDYDTEMQLAVDSIQQQLDTEEAGNQHSYDTPITEPVQKFVGKDTSLEVGRMSIHLKDITKARNCGERGCPARQHLRRC
ncbi:hypothetical protein NDU88_002522 [Pleurodeles waltl]|uniref:Uncharacterized protein n=1 Tax=Pleurodeles waltl TaxID=8319 RepID=A0AAV7WPR0_PLEWA|nr:hypothetical protein NDU88_002522 [Pleurodeles waltl]